MAPSFTAELLRYLAWALIGLTIGSIGAVLAGRWDLGQHTARIAVLGILAYPVVVLVMILGPTQPDASSKATALAQTISHAMNCAPAGIGAGLVWIVAARRKRRPPID